MRTISEALESKLNGLYYFLKNLKDVVSKYEAIKIIAVEKDKDIFQMENHIKLALRVDENHTLIIEKTDENILFLE
ncbi:MAG: hypothetical protein ACYCVH_02910 [Ignavibacteriaceae bacterium]